MIKLQVIKGDQQQNRLYVLFPLIPPGAGGVRDWGQQSKYINKVSFVMSTEYCLY
jgi:hypothetical protein